MKDNKEIVNIKLSDKDIKEFVITLSNALQEGNYAIDEITLDLTNIKTGKPKKIQFFKSFKKWVSQMVKEGKNGKE